MDLELLKKSLSVKLDTQLSEIFGEVIGRFPTHLGDKDPALARVWLWGFKDCEVATVDEGNSYCHIIQVENKKDEFIVISNEGNSATRDMTKYDSRKAMEEALAGDDFHASYVETIFHNGEDITDEYQERLGSGYGGFEE